MEIFAGVMGIFVIGLLGYAGAQIATGCRDLGHALAIGRHARRVRAGAAAAGAADVRGGGALQEGVVVLRGKARALRLLTPPAGGVQVVAWSARGAYGFGADAESAPFELESASADGSGARGAVVLVDARRLVLLAAEVTDTFGARVRAVSADAEVVVYGWLEPRAGGGACLRDVPGRGVVVAALGVGNAAVVANFARAAVALVAVALFVVTAVLAHLPQT